MMSHDVIMTFAGGLAAALVLGYGAQRIGLSPIVGYLLAGIVIGPHTPGFTASRSVAEQFAEIGIMLLMFGVGLKFHLHELLAVWRVAVPGALLQSLASTALAAVALHLLGWAWIPALIVGMAISVASTVVLVRVLTEHRDLQRPAGHVAIGWVVVEDLLTIGLLVMLPVLAGPAAGGQALWDIPLAFLKVAVCVGLVMVVGGRAIPWFLERLAHTRSSEMFNLGVLATALGIAVGSSLVFGVSMALGAFLAGLVVGRSEFAARAAGEAMPMRDAFAVLFFVSVGLLFDPAHVLREPLLIAVVLAVVLIGKPVAALVWMRIARRPWAEALPVAMALGQIGEFTFILGTTAKGLGLLDEVGWNTLVAVAMASIAINPALYAWSRTASRAEAPLPSALEAAVEGADRRCVVIGYGPVGRNVVRALRDRDVPVTVIEMNLATVQGLKRDGVTAVHGDALRWETLAEAGLDQAAVLVLSSDLPEPGEVVRLARARRPDLRILVRCAHLREVSGLQRLGATVVVSGEAEVAVTLTQAVIDDRGPAGEADRSAVRSSMTLAPPAG